MKKLIDLFHAVEDLGDQDSLHKMYEIWKSIIMMNNTNVLERIFQPDMIFDVFGALECTEFFLVVFCLHFFDVVMV